MDNQADSAFVCEDDPSFGCDYVSKVYNLCADVYHAKPVCPKFCNLCSLLVTWSDWGDWKCSDQNGVCLMTRLRNCSTGSVSDCSGSYFDIQPCNRSICTSSTWLDWEPWKCSYTERGCFMESFRNCSTGNNLDCDGKYFDVQICNSSVCPDSTTSSMTQITSPTVSSELDRKPTIYISPSGPIIHQLYSTSFYVMCSTDPYSTIHWIFNNNVTLPVGANVDEAGNLNIGHLNETNEGLYTCVAQSKTGLNNTAALTITIQETPSTVLGIAKHTYRDESPIRIRLECKLIGYPLPLVTWTFTDVKGVKNDIPGMVTYSNHRRIVDIPYFDVRFDGNWTCTAINRLGHSSASITVP